MPSCYLCGEKNFFLRKGTVRDDPSLKILECSNCGLVQLDRQSHIDQNFYKNSCMHGNDLPSMPEWLKETHFDDERRFNYLKPKIANSLLLDFGSGAGGFLLKASTLAAEVVGIELEERVRNYWNGQLNIFPSTANLPESSRFDLITAFHVVEHLPDPIETICHLGSLLKDGGHLVIEVPSADDALLTLYNCEAFQNFTYWSQHLFLFTASTLRDLFAKTNLEVVSIKSHQRYFLSNHLKWLCDGKPGGHKEWYAIDTDELCLAYANVLSSIGKSDTLIATLKTKT